MARALIVGCGCCGRALGERLLTDGWAVRGTSRREEELAAIEAAGIEPALADPERPGTLLELVGDVAVVVLALGSVDGDRELLAAIHGPRLEALAERLVDTPVRGVVYEASGTVDPAPLAGGATILGLAASTWRIPVELVEADRGEPGEWVEAMAAGVRAAISPAG
ncbi:MAG: NAD(P)H-binding protein [Actinobacteria bacterium]|nr:NAD(P)H-binding protein [Actinomycetota bacterium]